MARNPKVLLRIPQATSADRALRFTRANVDIFFDLYEAELDQLELRHELSQTWDIDESGITLVQYKYTKVVALKGKKQVGALTAEECGALVIGIFYMSAAGNYMPPTRDVKNR